MKFFKNTPKTPETSSDLFLIKEYQQSGDLNLLGDLYSRYMHLVYGVALSYFNDEERSKDAVMQIFEELIGKLKIHTVVNFKSWLHVLTRNHCLMALRKDARNGTESISDSFMEIEEPVHLEINADKESELLILERCLQSLAKEQQTSVELFYLQEKCYKEIADITGFELSKVKSYIQNGKRNLKICIEKNREQ